IRGRNIFERKPRQGFQERPKTTARVYRNPSDGHRPPMPPRTDGCGFLTLSVRGAVTQVTPPPGSVSQFPATRLCVYLHAGQRSRNTSRLAWRPHNLYGVYLSERSHASSPRHMLGQGTFI